MNLNFNADNVADQLKAQPFEHGHDRATQYIQQCIQGNGNTTFFTVSVRTVNQIQGVQQAIGAHFMSQHWISFTGHTTGTLWVKHSSAAVGNIFHALANIGQQHNCGIRAVLFSSTYSGGLTFNPQQGEDGNEGDDDNDGNENE